MSVFKVKKSPYYQFDFVLRGHRFYGSTERTVRKEAEKFEAVEREKAKELVKGKGSNLPDALTVPLTLPVTAQLVNDTNSICYTTQFATAKKNIGGKFKAKSP